ncbi:MAG: hypothetical protein ACRDGL_08365 [Candidatus Limnocylindrales bacterium]
MVRTIREHHALNGLRFSVVEFLVMAVLAAVLAGSAVAIGRPLLAVLLVGIVLNCLTVAAFGIAWLRAGVPDQPLAATFSPAARARTLRQHPDAQRATWILTAAVLVPYLVLALAGRDRGAGAWA